MEVRNVRTGTRGDHERKVRWLDWLLRVVQEDMGPAVAGGDWAGPQLKDFPPPEEWSKTLTGWLNPAERWALDLSPMRMRYYRRALTSFFREHVPHVRSPDDARPPHPLSEVET